MLLRRTTLLALRRPSHFFFLAPFSTIPKMASSTSSSSNPETPSSSSSSREALPAPGDDNLTTTLDISSGSTTVKLDALGPLVVNQDGTMSRISNWEKMSELEQKNTLRIIGKRNQQRLAALKQARGGGINGSGNDTSDT